jgi:hypothetical protein
VGKSERVEGRESVVRQATDIRRMYMPTCAVCKAVKSQESNFRLVSGEERVPKQLKQYGVQDRTLCLLGVNFSLYLS